MSGINDHRIKYLFEAVRLKSVRAAADYLNVAPSAVSRQISQLEQELFTPLIERHRRGINPTEAGERLLEYHHQHVAQQELLLDSLQSLRGLHSGSITLAIGEGYIDSVSTIISAFSCRYPGIRIQVEVCGSNEVIRAIAEDEAHIGILFNPARDTKLRSHQSFIHPLCVIAHPEHPIASVNERIEMHTLTQYRIALTRVSHGIRQIVTVVEEDTGISLDPTLVCNNLMLLKTYARDGGLTLLPSFMVEKEVADKQLVALPLHHNFFSATETHIVTRLGRQLGSGVNKLLQQILSTLFKG
ncbi:transcriptional regulator [Tatumella ptyseos ATCC 33301]|uniref:Transcriptional regulator n=1 Tax=Tatumella ptyseos ATCC 33301 TaxID=1005995 RepID=A0A085JPZ1_9GAMM|nr:LysR family transcriptional regulator [Tatumella ptyseos]KFD22537.1 transcriptional regulator [Tatumella ptyseos ATCC 33301]